MWRSSAALLALWPLAAQLSDRQLARDIFKQLIEINTTDSAGDNTRAAEAIGPISRSRIPENDIHVLAPAPRKGILVVRLRGAAAARPILF